jgi:hypothetical protein
MAIVLKLVVKKGLEPIESWTSLCKDPTSFLNEVASRLVGAYDIDDAQVVVSDKVPPPSDRNKLWIKTSWPYGIGKVIEGFYQMDYGMSGYMPNIPFQQQESLAEPLKGFVRKLTTEEVKNFGLFLADASKAATRMNWYIFEPEEISY